MGPLDDNIGAGLKIGMIDYWPLHEGSGTRFSALGRNNLTDNNTVGQAQGRPLQAAQFVSANSEYLSVASNGELQAGDIDFTIAGWFYLDSKTASMWLAAKDSTTSGEREFALYYFNTNDRFLLQIHKPTDVNVFVQADSLGSPATGTWYFVRGWHDAVTDTIFIQVNDGAIDSAATGGALQAASNGPFTIGARSPGSFFLNGRGCEVAYWKRHLAKQEHLWLYNKGLGRTYPFDGRPGPVLAAVT